ncbi:MAG: YraN family protein [Tannerellaceae bacterium]|nr:YraN family protein [Tannerellaceae bacterium]MCD8263767.1 YraN family protein [Tannerellaceae bacterium]
MDRESNIGKAGEQYAKDYLLAKGYRVLHTNWRWHRLELDIVAATDEELVVIEVKTRSAGYLVLSEKAVDRKKINRIVKATDVYIRYFNIDLPARFDVIVVIAEEGQYQLEHIEDAFFAPVH